MTDFQALQPTACLGQFQRGMLGITPVDQAGKRSSLREVAIRPDRNLPGKRASAHPLDGAEGLREAVVRALQPLRPHHPVGQVG